MKSIWRSVEGVSEPAAKKQRQNSNSLMYKGYMKKTKGKELSKSPGKKNLNGWNVKMKVWFVASVQSMKLLLLSLLDSTND